MSMEKIKSLKQRQAVEAVRKEEVNNSVTNTVKSEEVILENFDLADLEAIDTRHKNMSGTVKGSGCLTVINHERCGRRVHLANSIWRELGCPKFVKLYIKPKNLFVTAGTTGGIAVKFDRTMLFEDAVENYNGKVVLYATETVKRLTADWSLEFDDNCCYTGGTYKKCTINGTPAIVITKDAVVEKAEADTTEAVEDVTESGNVDAVGNEN